MLLISLCYGKQTVVSEDRGRHESASADGIAGADFDGEIILTDVEQANHLMTYDLGLAETDAAWHSPSMTFATMRVMTNMRVRSQQAENRRRGKWQDKNEQYRQNGEDQREERRERRDSVPPLRSTRHIPNTHTRARSRERSMSQNPGRDHTQSRQPRTPPQPPPLRTPSQSPGRTTERPSSSSYRRGTTPPCRERR